jgi:nucleolar MIF4G domain-containing protein 1
VRLTVLSLVYLTNPQEKTYNPYYAMIAQNLCQQSHSHQVTLQFCLWDLLREMGEHEVGGLEMLKLRGEHVSFDVKGVPETRRRNIAKAYAWWLAKGSLSLAVLKVG